MKIIRNPQTFQKEMNKLRRQGKTLGLVPTMGALHEGHLSLVRQARKENQIVVVSIFVNPLQFGPHEDFRHYPRNLKKDSALLAKEKVDFIFAPSTKSLYPADSQTLVEVTALSNRLCGKFRPGHFRGVATVVAKLFNLARPHRAYFGAKDYQQAMIIKQLARDLDFGIDIQVLPIIRDRDGLALSSRNAYLSLGERSRALSIPHALVWARQEIKHGNRDLRALRSGIRLRLSKNLDRIDYIEVMQPDNLKSVKRILGKLLVAVAGWVGKTRLIDNVIIHVPKSHVPTNP